MGATQESISLPPGYRAKLDTEARRRGLSRSRYAATILITHLDRVERARSKSSQEGTTTP